MRASGHRRFGRNERGSITIEFVVMLPLFLATLAFAFEFGRIFLAHQATVNNVRAASRYLSRSNMMGDCATETGDIGRACHMVRTGRLTGGTAPDYLTPSNAEVSIDPSYSTFGPPNFSRNGVTFRIYTRVDFPLLIFGFIDRNGPATIPFVVVEDARHIGV